MEVTGTVEVVTEAKSGKSLRVKIGDSWFGAHKKSGLDNMRGQNIKATWEDGDFGPWIEEWSHAAGAPAPAPAPQADSSGSRLTLKDRSIIMQSVAKATLSPDMTDEQIRSRLHFLWDLTAEVVAWG